MVARTARFFILLWNVPMLLGLESFLGLFDVQRVRMENPRSKC